MQCIYKFKFLTRIFIKSVYIVHTGMDKLDKLCRSFHSHEYWKGEIQSFHYDPRRSVTWALVAWFYAPRDLLDGNIEIIHNVQITKLVISTRF